jgi:multimeric flavodoxin WrbA
MKILGISGSPRGSQSTTLRLVKAALEGAKSAGAEVELIDLCQLKIEYCNACQVCFKTAKCVHKDDFQAVYEKMMDADGMVWGSPNYFRSVTAQMKAAIDRMADAVHCQLLTGKYCCSISSAGGPGYDEVTDYLNGLLMHFGSFVTGAVGVSASAGPAALEKAEEEAFDLGLTLAENVKSRRDYPEQRAALKESREYFMRLVKLHGPEWEHEYEHWNSLNWK